MSELDYLSSVLLGVVQGLTEFLPVSSSGHLALGQRWLNYQPDSPPMLLFTVFAHVGTLIAVVIVFAQSARRYLRSLIGETRSSGRGGKRIAWRITLLALAASVPTAAIGLTLKDTFERAFDKPVWIAAAFLVTGVLLALTVPCGRGRRGWRRFTWWQAVLVGLAQALAILPGISRSGATICVATYCGLRRRWAAEFSFLIAAPAIAGASLLKLRDACALSEAEFADLPWGPIAVGGLVSLVAGVFALKLLLGVVHQAKLHYFALYCWLVGTAVLLTAW